MDRRRIPIDLTDRSVDHFHQITFLLILLSCGYVRGHIRGFEPLHTFCKRVESISNDIILGPLSSYLPGSRIDISDEFSFDHMLEFAKLATAFAVELGQWEQ